MALSIIKDSVISDDIKTDFHSPILVDINFIQKKMRVHLGSYVSENDFDSGNKNLSANSIIIDMVNFDGGQLKFLEDIEEFNYEFEWKITF